MFFEMKERNTMKCRTYQSLEFTKNGVRDVLKRNFKDIMEKTFDKGPKCSLGSRKDNPLPDFYVARSARSVAP